MNNNILEISGLSRRTSEKDIKDIFEIYGQIEQIIRIDDNTIDVKFEDYRDAQDALELDKRQLDNETINVKISSVEHKSENNTKLIVSNIPKSVTISHIRNLFEEYGSTEEVKMIDVNTAIVKFYNYLNAQDALDLNSTRFHGNIIFVEFYKENPSHRKKTKLEYWNDIPNFDQFKKLYAFPIIPGIELVTVPEDLQNEPYALEDTGYRPDIRIRNKSFNFEVDIESEIARIKLGSNTKNFPVSVTYDTKYYPSKLKTNVSIFDIYENYGLNIAYSYMKNIYYNPISRKFPEWLLYYIGGSLLVIDPSYEATLSEIKDTERNAFILYLCSLLLIKLVYIDNNIPKLPVPLSKVTDNIPIDIISKIINSDRVSKNLGRVAQHNKCIDMPMTYDELDSTYWDYFELVGVNLTYYSKNENIYSCLYELNGDHFKFALEIKNQYGPFYLTDTNNEESDTDTDTDTHDEDNEGIVQQYPLFIYNKAYLKRGCTEKTTKTAILSMLDELSKMIVNENNYKDISAWLVQLTVDTDSMETMTLKNYTELESAFHKVVRIAIDLVKNDKL
jgi:RNA recognition motif-containing protein